MSKDYESDALEMTSQVVNLASSSAEARAAELGLDLTQSLGKRVGKYVPAVQVGEMLYTCGSGARRNGESVYRGVIGEDLTVEEGYESARLAGVQTLVALRNHLGSLDRVRQVVRLTGYMRVSEGFIATPAVLNGISDLMLDVFGDAGRHTRTSVGVTSLAWGISVEVEGIFAIHPD